jgi:acetyl esterase/lipase
MPLAMQCARALPATLAILEYSLAPEFPYPAQLIQAIAALNFLFSKHSPAEIIIGGDSAGGHLVLSLLAHIKQPSKYAPPISPSGPLRAVIMISPCVGLKFTAASYDFNAENDTLTREGAEEHLRLWNPRKDEVWADPQNAASDRFWESVFSDGADALVESGLLIVGTEEVFLDDNISFAKMAGVTDGKTKSQSRLDLIKSDGDIHVGAAVDLAIGLKGGNMMKAILEWLKMH